MSGDDMTNQQEAGWVPLLQVSSEAWLGVESGGVGDLWLGDFWRGKRRIGRDDSLGLLHLLEKPHWVVGKEIEEVERSYHLPWPPCCETWSRAA